MHSCWNNKRAWDALGVKCDFIWSRKQSTETAFLATLSFRCYLSLRPPFMLWRDEICACGCAREVRTFIHCPANLSNAVQLQELRCFFFFVFAKPHCALPTPPELPYPVIMGTLCDLGRPNAHASSFAYSKHIFCHNCRAKTLSFPFLTHIGIL